MDARLNRISLAWGIPGILIQLPASFVCRLAENPWIAAVAWLASLVGTVLLMVGLAYYARAKGRSPAWCLLGFLSIVGLIVLGVLKDKSSPAAAPAGRTPGASAPGDVGMSPVLPVLSGWAIAAGYLGLFTLLIVPAPLALATGIYAIVDIRRHPTKRGMGRAIFGVVLGALGTLVLLLGLFILLTARPR
ncbi:MAG: DUF4190 domain-containing protein [Planctomycetes bacterium]|nr:DUF4190 domain-containing protein [Planctomycetota bacterium]